MPFEVLITDDGRGMVYLGQGELLGAEVLDTMRAGLPDPGLIINTEYSLIDFSEVTSVDAPREIIQAIAAAAAELAKVITSQYVVFACPDPLVFGLSRVYLTFIDGLGWETAIFETLDEAKASIRRKTGNESLTFSAKLSSNG